MMKRRNSNPIHYIFVMLVASAISGCSLLASVPESFYATPDEHGFYLHEKFESADEGGLPKDWTVGLRGSGNGNIPSVVARPGDIPARPGSTGDKLLRIVRESEEDPQTTDYAYVDFKPIAGKIKVSFWFYATNDLRILAFSMRGVSEEHGNTDFLPNGSSSIYLAINHGGKHVRVFSHRDTDNKAHWVSGPEVTANTWHKVTLEIDAEENKFVVYIDDDEQSAVSVGQFVHPTDYFTGFAFSGHSNSSSENNTMPVYVDEVWIEQSGD